MLYRVDALGQAAPSSVGVSGVNVTVNQGGDLPAASGEAAVNGSKTSAWYYDAKAQPADRQGRPVAAQRGSGSRSMRRK